MTRAENGNWKIETGKFPSLLRRGYRGGPELPSLLRRGLRGGELVLLLALALLAVRPASAQVATGFPPYGSFSGGPFDTVNNANLNVHFSVPVENKAGRDVPFNYDLSYDSAIWMPTGSTGSQTWTLVGQASSLAPGWRGFTEAYIGYYTYTTTQYPCYVGQTNYPYPVYSNFTYHDPQGTVHVFNISTNLASQCGSAVTSGSATATDGSGLFMSVTNYTGAVIYTRAGDIIQAPVNATSGAASSFTDSNGNEVTGSYLNTFTDTLNTTAMSLGGGHSPSVPTTFGYTAASGSQAFVEMNWQSYVVQTNFGCTGIAEYGASVWYLPSSVVLPDGTSYSFTYEVTPNDSHNPHYVTGRLASVQLPTGGTISYSYSGGSHGITCADGSTATLARTTPDGTWTYAHTESGSAWTTTLTDPQTNVTTFNFVTVATPNFPAPYETERQIASLETIYTCYNGASFPCNSTAITLPITQRTVTTSIGGLESQTNTKYNSYDLPTEVDVYGFGSGAVGSLISKKTVTYNTSLSNNINNRPSTVSLYNGSGTLLRQSSYSYDGGSPTATSGTPQHSNPSGSRGNLTSLTLSGSGFSNISKSIAYYDTGQKYVVTDFNGAQTTYNSGTGGSAACGNSFDTTISLPMSLSRSQAWNCNGALTTSTTDPNNNPTSFSFDSMNRISQTSYPDVGLRQIQYTSATERDFCTLITGSLATAPPFCVPGSNSLARHGETLFDGLGRNLHQDLVSDPTGETYVDLSYDSLGRLSTHSNPYRSTKDPTYGSDSYSYDALNRLAKTTHADSSYSQVSYGSGSQSCSTSTYGYGYPALFTDESGNQRRTFTDPLGRTIEVDEPDPTNHNSLTLATCYVYDAQGDLTSVVQGSETRTYTYDGLKRRTSETTPEAGTTNYYFTTSGGGLCANNQKLVCRKTDARNITTTYTYDALDRLTGKSYSNGDASITYYYDQTSYNGLTITNGIGRRTGMSDGSGKTAWSYDKMGRIVAEERTIGSVTNTLKYGYNLDGSRASITYPSGRIISYTYGNDARPVSGVDSANSINYTTTATYAPQGVVQGAVLGESGSFGGITYDAAYNNRLMLSTLTATSSAANALNLSFSYYANGNVETISNNLNTSRTESFTYDDLNRVSTAASQAPSGTYCWGQSFGYDRYANLDSVTATACTPPTLSLSINSNNQITNTGYTYDASGDLTADGTYSYTWNARHLLQSAAGVTYTYDGDGKRVEKSNGVLYWNMPDGTPLAETNSSGTTMNEYIFFNGARIARRDSSGNVYYYFID
jgi:YD repeat-containing protein